VAVVLFKKALTGAFQPSGYTLIAAERLTLDFVFTTTGAPSTLEFYLEFASDPKNGPWHRELAEEDTGKGNVSMPEVVRTFATNNKTTLDDGDHKFSTQFRRQEAFARLQMRITAGACAQFTVTDPFGSTPAAP
jgi:hypothetical protein